MKREHVVRLLVLSVALVAGRAPSAGAQPAGRAFVSTLGNDAQSCAITAPCRTLTGGIAKVAPGGEVVVLDSGNYGAGSITKAVRVTASAGVTALVVKPITIAAAVGDTVVLRGLTIKPNPPLPDPGIGGGASTGTGITFVSGGTLHLENSVIDGWDEGLRVMASTPTALCQSAPVGMSSNECKIAIEETTFRNCGVGLYADNATSKISVEHSHFDHNGNGLFIRAGRVALKDTVISGSTVVGIDVESPSSDVTADRCLIAQNDEGVDLAVTAGGGTFRLSSSTVTGNGIGIKNFGGGIFETFGNNAIRGNLSDIQSPIVLVALQ